ncbi:MAG: autotransporter outer membrane beta-barrel domain-containing protein [Planctomycetaceae bacterium]|jgi:outer membrane autotransporter protein|nr:autotransporter outer membrane beta-barrel domain-containing protein [Planctomycetaceae bacterium]
MNTTKSIFALVIPCRWALPLCAMLLFALTCVANTIELDDNDLLNVEEEETVTLNDTALEGLGDDMVGIVIGEGGKLTIDKNTHLYLKGTSDSGFDIINKGTLILIAADNNSTTITSGELNDDGLPKDSTPLLLSGGLIEIKKGTPVLMGSADMETNVTTDLMIVVDGEGGTVDVNNGLTFESGIVIQRSQNQHGGLTKTGKGTWKVGSVTLGTKTFNVLDGTVDVLEFASIGTLNVGKLEIDEDTGDETGISTGNVYFWGGAKITTRLNLDSGNVYLYDDASVGELNSKAGTVISGLYEHEVADEENVGDMKVVTDKSKLTISNGGSIKGTLEDIGTLVLTGGTLTVDGGSHTLEQLWIAGGAEMDLKSGTDIRLTSEDEDASSNYDDIIVYGTLKIASDVIGIYKGNLATKDLDDVFLTVAGGIVEIYKSDDVNDDGFLRADTLHTQILSIGKIKVESGVTFQSGDVKFSTDNNMGYNMTGANMIVSGGGTYQAGKVNLGTGYLMVQNDSENEKTTMEFLQDVTAGALITRKDTKIIAHDNAIFGAIDLSGNYNGSGHNLEIKTDSYIAGQISNVNELTTGGNLLLRLGDSGSAGTIISVATWNISAPDTTHIRVFTRGAGTYENVIQIVDDESRATLLGILRNSETPLYRPKWTVNTVDNTFLDLNLQIRTVKDYVKDDWKRKGRNAEKIGTMLDNIPDLRERLEGLNEPQLRNVLRRAMAGELAGNAAGSGFSKVQSANSVFRHLDNAAPLQSPFVSNSVRGQVREGYNVWFNAFGQSEHAESDGNASGYDTTRYGFHVGYDVELYRQAVAGVLFGYANPNVKSDLGSISANDYTAGLYLRLPLYRELFLNSMVGFGIQDYTHKSISSNFRGNSYFANIELTRPFSFSVCRLTPLVAVDFQTADMEKFSFTDSSGTDVMIRPGNMNSTALRVGLLGEFGRFRTRVQYMNQVAGNDYVSFGTDIYIAGDLASTTQIRGTQWGRDWLNVGVGGDLLTTRNWRVFADYNFDMGKHTTSHLGSLNTAFTW